MFERAWPGNSICGYIHVSPFLNSYYAVSQPGLASETRSLMICDTLNMETLYLLGTGLSVNWQALDVEEGVRIWK